MSTRTTTKTTTITIKTLFKKAGIVVVVMPLVVALLLLLLPVGTITVAAVDTSTARGNQRSGLHAPCTYFDTVNVTGDVQFSNGSFLHDGILIPAQLVGLYDYVYKDKVESVPVEPHWRGCICKLKACINICCPWGTVYNSNATMCVNTTELQDTLWPEPVLNVTIGDGNSDGDGYGEVRQVDIFKHFAVQSFRPCIHMYALQPEMNSFDRWHMYENGSLLREEDNVLLTKNDYCFMPTFINDSDVFFTLNPANCDMINEYGTIKIINAYTMLFSIPFMLLTIVVYMAIPELRNQHGKSLVCYLVGLIVGYSMLSTIALNGGMKARNLQCKMIGYTAYYFFMAAFLWLSVISFDLWHNFRGTRNINRVHEKKRFLMYSLYSWGMAALFLLFTWYMQEHTDIAEHLKPGIGGVTDYCWIDMNTWSAMIYFFTPIIIIICANTVMFIMTAIKIHKVQREMARITAREDSNRNLRNEKDKFGLFLRLFIVMGVTWSMEIISYFVGTGKTWSKIFYITDLCNAMQGFLIFMLFVMKKKVKHLITNRYSTRRSGSSHQRQSQYSTKTTTSSVPNLTNMSIINAPLTEKPLLYERNNDANNTATTSLNLKYN